MSPDYLKNLIDRQFSDWMGVSPHRMISGDEVCKVTLPLLEPSGDVISVYVANGEQEIIVHDGGHIAGLLFESRPKGPTKQDQEVVDGLLSDSGLRKDSGTGLVNIETNEDGLRYWLMELGRVIALVPALIPTPPVQRRSNGTRRRMGRTARELTCRLHQEGYIHAITPQRTVQGITNRSHWVDLSYTASDIGFEGSKGISPRIVYILAVDLDVARPVDKAGRSIIAANDLVCSTTEEYQVDVRMVYGFGKADGVQEPAAKLLSATGEKSSFSSYSWDDKEEQSEFLTRVGQELAIPDS